MLEYLLYWCGNFAQELANELGVNVSAPKGLLVTGAWPPSWWGDGMANNVLWDIANWEVFKPE